MPRLPIRVGRLFSTSSRLLQKADLTDINPSEQSHFKELAASWWDETGSQRILHKMNLLRMDFINNTIKSRIRLNENETDPEKRVFIPGWNFQNLLPAEISEEIQREIDTTTRTKSTKLGLKCLDIGCGGGILSESLARLSMVSSVKGIDMTPEVIEVAKQQKSHDPMLKDKLQYEVVSLEHVPKEEKYNLITMMELLEHVDYPAMLVEEAMSHLSPGGYLFMSTINRDFVSWFTTIFMGEHVLNIVPVGTHTYSKYIKRTELQEFVEKFNKDFEIVDSKHCGYLPGVGWFFTGLDNIGNYMLAIKRK